MTATTNINPIRLYKVPEVAEMLSLPAASVRDLVDSRQLRVRRIHENSHPRIVGQSILDYLQVPYNGAAV